MPTRLLLSAALLVSCSRAQADGTEHTLAPESSASASTSVELIGTPRDRAASAIASSPGPLVDKLAPTRSLGTVASELASGDAWITARPPKSTQLSLTRTDRRVNPCESPDPGLGAYRDWTHVRPMGQFAAPRAGATLANGDFDLVVHFHGHRPARKELVRSGEDLVLLGVSLGIGAAYGPPFADPKLFETLVEGVERALAKHEGRPKARARRLALSGWSRGYEAIVEILAQPLGARVDALVLLDSLHSSREPARMQEQLAPFFAFAERARRGDAFFFASHSSIDPSEYASTTETVHQLIAHLGGRPTRVARRDPLGLDLIEIYTSGQFHARGYTGNGKLDHCAHFGVMPDALRALAKRWK